MPSSTIVTGEDKIDDVAFFLACEPESNRLRLLARLFVELAKQDAVMARVETELERES